MFKLDIPEWDRDQIKILVKSFGSIRRFCIATGLRPQSVSEWISGKRQPTVTSRWALKAIAQERYKV
ncbi:hypothetical protein D6827_01910 [Candidatus Parcubacteria bacterium]|nr:MAG: hypothetical protein D6827_01910 [Candidatus Parcubacteria bacterium]